MSGPARRGLARAGRHAGGKGVSPRLRKLVLGHVSRGMERRVGDIPESWPPEYRHLPGYLSICGRRVRRHAVPSDKIYLLQISDAYKMEPPLRETSARSRSEWSLSFRPLPYSGGYFPVEDFLGSVFGTGFRGWLSVEVFDSKPKEGMLVEDYTKTAMQSLTRLLASTIK